jgi:hypothetical protein
MGADDLVVAAIKQALSMLGQAREALIFAQCSTAVAKVRQAIFFGFALGADVAAVTERRSDRCSHLCLGVLHQRWG